MWCWRRLLRVPWTARRSNQSILKEISPGYSLEGLMLNLKLQYFGYLMWRVDSLEKDPDAGKDWGQEKGTTEDEMAGWHHWLNGHGFGWTPGIGDGQGGLACCGSWGRKESDTTERLNWTDSMGEMTWLVLSRKFMEISFGTIQISSFPFFSKLIVYPKPSKKIFGLLILFTMFSHYDYHSTIYSNLQLLPDLAILWVANSIHWFWQP